jgi:hypothetical protein
MSTPEIGLLLVWLGPWRPWIDLTLHSFAYNRGFALHIVSAETPPATAVGNVHYHQHDRQDLDRRISQLLGTGYRLERGYKLCDFRPAYRDLFPEYLDSYPYWGWCDEDIIWGDLGRFITPAILNSHDVIATCRNCISGQLTIVRHSPRTNALYSWIPGWKEKLLDQSTSYALDELPLNDVALGLEASGHLRVSRRQIQTHDVNSVEWNRWADELEMAETGHPHGEFKHGPAVWRDGRIYHRASGEEFGFFHFGNWKRTWLLPKMSLPPGDLSEWHFSENGIDFRCATASDSAREYIRAYRAACLRVEIQNQTRRLRHGAEKFMRRLGSAAKRLSAS